MKHTLMEELRSWVSWVVIAWIILASVAIPAILIWLLYSFTFL
jgi:hypothetical protein